MTGNVSQKPQRNPVMLVIGVALIGWSIYNGVWWLWMLPMGVMGLVVGFGREDLLAKFAEKVALPGFGAIDRIWNLIPEPPFHRWFVETAWAAEYREFFQKNPGLALFYAVFFAAACGFLMPDLIPEPVRHFYSRWGYAFGSAFLAYFAYLAGRLDYPVVRWKRALLIILFVAALQNLWLGTHDENEDQDPVGPHVADIVTDFNPTNIERADVMGNFVVVMVWGVIVGTIAGPAKDRPADTDQT